MPQTEPIRMAVGTFVNRLDRTLEVRVPPVALLGEVSQVRAYPGQIYFTLKDDRAALSCLLWRSFGADESLLREGAQVEASGCARIYQKSGKLTFTVHGLRPAGQGALMEKFLALKARLAAEGLFDAAAKRAVRAVPQAVGIVTSLKTAALHDALTTLRRRAPWLRIVVYPAPVQGEGAAGKIAAALRTAGSRAEVDTILLVRGGGSLEDLWAFNEEPVVRAIRACPIPVIAGIGHEIDTTLADLAADIRAATPTAAAERASSTQGELEALVAGLEDRAGASLGRRLDRCRLDLAMASSRILSPERQIELHRLRLAQAGQRLAAAMRQALSGAGLQLEGREERLVRAARETLARADRRLALSLSALQALNPLAVLGRGYAIVYGPGGHAAKSVSDLPQGTAFQVQLQDGSVRAVSGGS